MLCYSAITAAIIGRMRKAATFCPAHDVVIEAEAYSPEEM
jgi:hypothetical protein